MNAPMAILYYLSLSAIYACIFNLRPGHSWSGESPF